MAAAKALTIVDRWEVGGGVGGRKDGLAEKEDDAQRKEK